MAEVRPGEPAILLTHWPDPFPLVPERVALTLAGHTHCGQVNLPLAGRLIHASQGSARWPCGYYEEDGRRLFVTGGTGVSILPVRFNAMPEVVVITLSQGDGGMAARQGMAARRGLRLREPDPSPRGPP